LPKLLVRDNHDPNAWHLMIGVPGAGSPDHKFAILNSKSIVVSVDRLVVLCGQNPLAPGRPYVTWEVSSGKLVRGRSCGVEPADPKIGADHPTDFANVNFLKVPLDALTDVEHFTPTAEMTALLSMRERLRWLKTEFEVLQRLAPEDLSFIGAWTCSHR
jgi:hypothetical protein